MPLGKHYGAFAGGFAKSLTEMMKLYLMQQHYDALNKHYAAQEELWANRGIGRNKGLTPEQIAAGQAAGREWDKGGGGGGGAYDGGPKAEAHAQEMSQYLQDKWGLSKAGAAGVVGNAWQESKFASNFNPGGDSGTAAGMFQWRDTGSGKGARQTNARNYMAQNGLNPNDWRSHLDAAMDETKRDYPSMFNQLRTTDDPQYATHEFFHVFERGDPKQANFANRDGMAQAALGGKPTAAPKTETAAATDGKKLAGKAATTTMDVPTKGPDKGKTPAAKTASADDGSYQVAGLNDVALTPEQAAKSRADLEAHRAQPGDDRGLNPAALDAASPAPPPGAGPASTIPGGSSVDAQATAPAPPPSTAIPPGPTVDAQTYDRTMGPPERTGAPPNVGITPSSVPDRPVMGPDQRTGAPPTVGPTPSSAPPPVQGPPQRTGAPPNVGPTPSSVGEDDLLSSHMPVPPVGAGGEYRRMPYVGETASGSQRDPKGVYGPKPTPIARDTGARPDLTARSPATTSDADKPSPNAQPVSSPALPSRPQAAPATPGYVQVTAPNSDPTDRNRPQMTALDLSHLWGPNPPLSQRAQAPAPQVTPQSNPRQNDWSDVASAPAPDDLALGMQLGAAKGGAIPSRATMKFAAGGASAQYPSYSPTAAKPSGLGLSGNTLAADQYMLSLPGMAQVDLTGQPAPYYTSYGPGQGGAGGQALTANWSKMTPDQLAQYNAMVAGTWQPPAPAAPAPPPAAAPAPAPVVVNPPSVQNITNLPDSSTMVTDPTTGTITGAPKLPNTITAKSYDPNVDQQTGAGFSNTSNQGGTDYSVGEDDLLKQNASGQIAGSRKGGPITPRVKGFAQGGIPTRPTLGLAAGGGALYGPGTMTSPAYSGPTTSGGWVGTPFAQMAPNQQAWATQQQALIGARQPGGGLNLNTLSMTPDAIWPTAPPPAAPTTVDQPPPTASTINQPVTDTTVTDPTTGTVTGAPSLPNAITAKSYDPNVDQQTGAGFTNTSNAGGTNYSVGDSGLLKTNDQNQIAGSRKGGPITRRVTTRYDDGGGVSPSAAGMPPGLGGQSAIPPIYYNPATYSPAGAPVGKGVTQTNANTFNAGAIPSLPMARGGVVAFDDGGEVSIDPTPDLMEDRQTAQDDQMTTALLDQRDATSAPTSAAQGGYFSPADYQTPAYGPTSQPQKGGSPAGVLPMTPEISDGQGNPSKGLIGAISDGLHWLGSHLGIGGAQAAPAIAGDPQTHGNRSNFAQGHNVGGWDQDQQQQVGKMIDPSDSLNGAERQIAVMEGTYKYMLSQGDSAGAGKMAASILQYSVQTSQKYAEEAARQLYDGNLKGAVDNINHASDAVPDGRLVHVTLDPDGKNVTVVGKDMSGRALWQQRGSAEAILQYATNRGRTGQMQWDALEEQASKYDPTFAQMAKNRALGANARVKEAADTEAQAAANEQISKFTPQFDPVDQPGAVAPASAPTAPAIPRGPSVQTASLAPTVPTASTQGAPPTPDGRGAAPSNAPPPTADSNAPVALGPTGHGGALPSTPSADIPAAGAQNVDLEHDAGYQSIVANTTPKYFTSDGRPIVGVDANGNPQAMRRPQTVDAVTLKSYAPQVANAYRESWQQYQAAVQQNQASMRQDIDGQRRDYSANLVSQRTAGAQAHSDAAAMERERYGDQSRASTQAHQDQAAAARVQAEADAKALAARTAEEHAARAPRPDADVNRMFALTPEDQKLAVSGAAKRPEDYYKEQFGLTDQGQVDPKLAEDGYNKAFNNRNDRISMNNALVNGWRYTHDADPSAVADGLRGFVLNAYTGTAQPVPPDGYGPRYAVTFTRPSDQSSTTVVLPRADWQNILQMKNRRQPQEQGPSNTPDTPNWRASGLGIPPRAMSEGNYAAGP